MNNDKSRLRFIRDAEKRLRKSVRNFQWLLFSNVQSRFIDKLDVENGIIKPTAANYRKLKSIGVAGKLADKAKKGIIDGVINSLLIQVGLVGKAYVDAKNFTKKTEDSVRNKMLLRLGMSGNKLEYGVLFDMLNETSTIRDIQAQAFKALSGGMNRQDFEKQMKNFIEGDGKLGVAERHIYTAIHDIYAQNDRIISKTYADELGLTHFLYTGDVIKTTRDFCLERVGKAFTKEEIERFGTSEDVYGGYTNKSKGEFQGKPDVYDPFADAGGYNCRHILRGITEEEYDRR